MFKNLINRGSDFSATFISSAQTMLSTTLNSDLLNTIENVTGQVRKIAKKAMNAIKVEESQLQSNTYGKIIPEVFGSMRIAGNIIWCSTIVTKEVRYSSIPLVSKAVSIFRLPSSSVTVRGSFAVALCKGPIDDVTAIYGDEQMIDLSKIDYQVYLGTEDQLPNSTIQSYIKDGVVPAFRGIAYVVFTDFPMEIYNGRIPNLSFDVVCNNKIRNNKSISPEKLITGVNIIPGCGEFVYDTKTQYSYAVQYFGESLARISQNKTININNNEGVQDSILSLKHLKRDLPEVKWVSVVVAWFTNSLDIKEAKIFPAFEESTIRTEPDAWIVSVWNMNNGVQILRDENNNPIYGGTIADSALHRYLDELKKRGYKICLYPMIFVNKRNKPWRGRMTGSPEDIETFFHNSTGYNAFIMHYANNFLRKIDAFIIGSEFIGLTKIKDSTGEFPAVNEFINIAKEVKAKIKSLGLSKVIVTYAADWSEYHHEETGIFNLDKLWSCSAIDVIGIDAYFPLSNSPQSIYDIEAIKQGWLSGEGFDFYYADDKKTNPLPLQPAYAWKNIKYFWENYHINPDGNKTTWEPKMKKIWFTEYGFPSVDCATNSPNVFYSMESIDGGFPVLSKGRVDFKAQRCALYASELLWQGSEMVEQKFVWTWDARPYPFFPALLNVWNDGIYWKYGHFLNGKIGYSSLADIVLYLCMKCGFREDEVDVDSIDMDIDGYIINSSVSVINHIILLSEVFNFDGYFQDNILVFRFFRDFATHDISMEDIIMHRGELLFVEEENTNSSDFPSIIELLFQNREDGFRPATIRSISVNPSTDNMLSYKLGLAVNIQTAELIVNSIMLNKSIKTHNYIFTLPIDIACNIMPMDIVKIFCPNNEVKTIRVQSINVASEFMVEILGVSDDERAYHLPSVSSQKNVSSVSYQHKEVPTTMVEIFQVPSSSTLYPQNHSNFRYTGGFNENQINQPIVYFAIYSNHQDWRGCDIYASEDGGSNYFTISQAINMTTTGYCVNSLSQNASCFTPDNSSYLDVYIYCGDTESIYSINDEEWFNHVNLALVGNEIVAFKNVEHLSSGLYRISGFLRGRNGTEKEIEKARVGERCVFLSCKNLIQVPFNASSIGKKIIVKIQSKGEDFESANEYSFYLSRDSISSLPPINIQKRQIQDDIEISITPRPLVEINFFDDVDSKNVFEYNVIIQNENGDGVRKIFFNNQSKFLYTAQMQQEDFGHMVKDINIIFERL